MYIYILLLFIIIIIISIIIIIIMIIVFATVVVIIILGALKPFENGRGPSPNSWEKWPHFDHGSYVVNPKRWEYAVDDNHEVYKPKDVSYNEMGATECTTECLNEPMIEFATWTLISRSLPWLSFIGISVAISWDGKCGKSNNMDITEGSLEVKLPTIWTDEKQSRAEAERRERLEERRVEEKESEERRCRSAKR